MRTVRRIWRIWRRHPRPPSAPNLPCRAAWASGRSTHANTSRNARDLGAQNQNMPVRCAQRHAAQSPRLVGGWLQHLCALPQHTLVQAIDIVPHVQPGLAAKLDVAAVLLQVDGDPVSPASVAELDAALGDGRAPKKSTSKPSVLQNQSAAAFTPGTGRTGCTPWIWCRWARGGRLIAAFLEIESERKTGSAQAVCWMRWLLRQRCINASHFGRAAARCRCLTWP
jgi:hypothetical protein